MNQSTMEKKKNINKKRITNVILVVVLVAVFISGVLLCMMKDSIGMMAVHKLSSVIFVIGCIVHMLQHRKRKEIRHVS